MKFQTRVLKLVKKIPKGKVSTYKEVARALGNPLACRAVANALAKNPLLVKIPCHRVIRSDGKVGGYKLGTEQKIKLLKEEGIEISNEKIDLKKYMFRF